MKTARLYLLLLTGVLILAGCGQDRSTSGSDDPISPPDTTAPDTTAVAPGASSSSPATEAAATESAVRVVVLGNSIAAGYGLPRPEEQSFPGRLQQRVDSLGWDVTVQNAGVSGETTAGGLRRIGWLLRSPLDVLVLELGGNDGLRGLDLDATRSNLTAIIDTTLSTYPQAHVVLAGMQIPPNLGPDYTQRFRNLYPDIANDRAQVSLIPFVLEGVGGVDSLMQSDGIHPTAAGQRIVANNVWSTLHPVLERKLGVSA